jgi:catechol 2,3-dioxygenase-like lactoylglutathione lyase family enzyme
MIKGIQLVYFPVVDLARARSFYTETLGFTTALSAGAVKREGSGRAARPEPASTPGAPPMSARCQPAGGHPEMP